MIFKSKSLVKISIKYMKKKLKTKLMDLLKLVLVLKEKLDAPSATTACKHLYLKHKALMIDDINY